MLARRRLASVPTTWLILVFCALGATGQTPTLEDAALGVPWPAIGVTSTPYAKVTAANLRPLSKVVVENLATVRSTPAGWKLIRFADHKDYASLFPDRVSAFASSGMIEPGDEVREVTWTIDGIGPVRTFAIVGPTGETKFEPLLSLDGPPAEVTAGYEKGSWKVTVSQAQQNWFGSSCVLSEWELFVQSLPGCKIDPPPHLRRISCRPRCWGWEQQCAEGEFTYCSPKPECPACGEWPTGEQCIKYVLETAWATLGSEVELTAGAGGSYEGVDLSARISIKVDLTGTADTIFTIGTVCAESEPLVNGDPVPLADTASVADEEIGIQALRSQEGTAYLVDAPSNCGSPTVTMCANGKNHDDCTAAKQAASRVLAADLRAANLQECARFIRTGKPCKRVKDCSAGYPQRTP